MRKLYGPELWKQYKGELKNTMPGYKVKHSQRIGKRMHKLGMPQDAITAGLFHDYSERGGNLAGLDIPDRSKHLASLMTNPDKSGDDDPLAHLKEVVPLVQDPEVVNHLMLLKMNDRYDNLMRRIKGERLSKDYLRRSQTLLRWLVSQYKGDPAPLQKMLKKLAAIKVKV